MSRFFATGDTDTESSSESSDDEPKLVGGARGTTGAAIGSKVFTFSDDEEEEKRVVRSQKDKRYDELRSVVHAMKNSQKIKDIAKVQSSFEALQKAFQKAKSVVEKEGSTPVFYTRTLTLLEDFVLGLWNDKDAKQKLSKPNAKALTTLKQKVRKYNKEFEAEIESFRENPINSEDEREGEAGDEKDEEEEAEEEEEEVEVKKKVRIADEVDVAPAGAAAPAADLEDEEDDDVWGMLDESEESSSEDEAIPSGKLTLEYFLKKDYGKAKTEKAQSKPDAVQKAKKPKEKKEGVDEGGWQIVPKKGSGQLTKQDILRLLFGKDVKDVDVDVDMIIKKRNELISDRGKKTVEMSSLQEKLRWLMDVASQNSLGVGVKLRLLADLIETTFDFSSVAYAMKEDAWKTCVDELSELLTLLEENPAVEYSTLVRDDEENFKEGEGQVVRIQGNILTLLERADDEFIKILQSTDAHSTDYVTKLQGEKTVCSLIQRVQAYLEHRLLDSHPNVLCQIYIRRIEHLYYKVGHKNLVSGASTQAAEKEGGEGEEGEERETLQDQRAEEEPEDSLKLMTQLTKFIYNCQSGDMGRIRTRAMLCQIYHHALHDRWYQAKDLMMMSHLQEGIQHADVPTQILYNRSLVQLGMCAFRHGMIKDAHDALMDVQSSGRSKELLAQGLISRHERSVEQQKVERRRQVPFHMHINLELMECVYLTSAMLMEVPYMAAAKTEGRRRIISKSFHHQLRYHEKQPLVGPPESMREHVIAATHAMRRGDWKKCRNYILEIKVWELFIDKDPVKEMLARYCTHILQASHLLCNCIMENCVLS
ncbi:Eukaryotic translation initiation factor 3 subunit C [Geodia barretti]|uniref:Eukaryotic translation initiation factor 3 subunit C n=1 Tax=Geodia barretti TaxID=519541 RepID=A0AA35SSQ1_GEOBA|nr:Eukaryotic translation initiation factor 3 subunit C [Geodia barretti]